MQILLTNGILFLVSDRWHIIRPCQLSTGQAASEMARWTAESSSLFCMSRKEEEGGGGSWLFSSPNFMTCSAPTQQFQTTVWCGAWVQLKLFPTSFQLQNTMSCEASSLLATSLPLTVFSTVAESRLTFSARGTARMRRQNEGGRERERERGWEACRREDKGRTRDSVDN